MIEVKKELKSKVIIPRESNPFSEAAFDLNEDRAFLERIEARVSSLENQLSLARQENAQYVKMLITESE